MPHTPIFLLVAITAVAPTFAFHNFNPDFLPKHSEHDVSPLYDGFPPEGTDPLALGFYATQEIIDPGTWDVGNFTSEHWFHGFSRQHRFEIKDGKVSYRSRNGSDEVQDFVREIGLYPGGSSGNGPCKAIFGAFEVTFRDKSGNNGDSDKNSVAIAHIKNFPGFARNSTNFGPMVNLVITSDGGNALQQIDPVTLEPIELFIYDGPGFSNPGSTLTSAHPGIGPNHEVYNYILDIQAEPPMYQVFAIEADGREEGAPILDFIQPWDPERLTLFYVIDKKNGGVVAKYTAPTFFAFHEVNSFEDGEDIVIDLAVFPDNSWLENARLVHLRQVGPNNPNIDIDLAARFRRFRLESLRSAQGGDDRKAKIELEIPYDIGNIELPRINDNYHHKPYRYAYGVHTVKRGFFVDSIVKIDIETQTTKLWVPGTNHLPSEPIFVPRPGCDDEDDGVLLTVAMDSETSRSNLVVIDAKSMKELGRANMPIAMGYGFHGIWGA
ncbi:hypothetical protein P171DRAFT_440796 [Karstenula rhodostoma CBS 690.94]|uniref:Carotenoid oxygenase n=1 Tax=Karstenula rhodostoma CBS 690.94 TaxID=1392251 RepID=A0A9P4UFU3_9PLEO|nr:hypothetical protein P171DRAFT_440796 [Karstenula rhodostoma CBS 690.94]